MPPVNRMQQGHWPLWHQKDSWEMSNVLKKARQMSIRKLPVLTGMRKRLDRVFSLCSYAIILWQLKEMDKPFKGCGEFV